MSQFDYNSLIEFYNYGMTNRRNAIMKLKVNNTAIRRARKIIDKTRNMKREDKTIEP